MRYAIVAWLGSSALYLSPLAHSLLGYPFTLGDVVPPPNPEISLQDAQVDRPPDEDFLASGFRGIGRGEAYSFTLGGIVTPCSRSWRTALRNMQWGDLVQLSGPLLGQTGICDWYSLRIVDSTGQEKYGFGCAGPRKTGQMPGIANLSSPNSMAKVNVRVGPRTVTRVPCPFLPQSNKAPHQPL